jgi:cytochrome c556
MSMQRKWSIPGVTMVSVAVLTAGLSLADEDEGPLHKLMEKVNAKSTAIKKAVRTPVAYKKAQAKDEIVKNGEEVLKLAKEAREQSKEGVKKAKEVKDPEKKFVELMDALIAQTEKFVAVAGNSETKQKDASSAFRVVSQRCTDCHNIFRIEEEDKF